MKRTLVLATRRSPLALAQTALVRRYLQERMADVVFEVLPLTTTGDKRPSWSLPERGGKGLFTRELESALVENRAQLAIHSAKDLPTALPEGLAIAGYLPRASAHDVLVVRSECGELKSVATGSPRRRQQACLCFPNVQWLDIRGNVETRLRKIAAGEADATILAAAGLERLNIRGWPGLKFRPFALDEIVPAAGQGAIAVECVRGQMGEFAPLLDSETRRAVETERLFLHRMGGGCDSASAVCYSGHILRVFHEPVGIRKYSLAGLTGVELRTRIEEIVEELNDR